jgi:hypothetical protein
MSDDEISARLGGILADEVWKNNLYQVTVLKKAGEFEGRTVVKLSIKRHDRKPVSNWRDKQEIKNYLVGRDCEGVELYPAEVDRKHDQANIYHLWVVDDPHFRFPFGFKGRVTQEDEEDDVKGELVEEQ